MSGRSVAERRKIRRALGPQALDALTSMDDRALEIDRFLLIQHSFWARLRFFVTGKF